MIGPVAQAAPAKPSHWLTCLEVTLCTPQWKALRRNIARISIGIR
jgi:hypothetical protein